MLPHLQVRRYPPIAQAKGMRRSESPAIDVLLFERFYACKEPARFDSRHSACRERFPNILVTIARAGDEFEEYRRSIGDHRYFRVGNRRIEDEETAQLFADTRDAEPRPRPGHAGPVPAEKTAPPEAGAEKAMQNYRQAARSKTRLTPSSLQQTPQ